ncbi:SMI1/KNR4 family protein [Saccharomonospora sp. NPDC046836]|uniref:SMI1/KNR4 family protein n=1 Tax=Saccharomonospora sp. NPDC046836 TaxID=3156921 RepID=UPI0033EAD817
MTAGFGTDAEAAVHTVLTAAEDGVDEAIGRAALLLTCAGAAAEADRLIRHWRTVTERGVSRLAAHPLTARAWAMLLAARGTDVGWAAELDPVDLDAEAEAHRAHLVTAADKDPLASAAAEAEAAAAAGDHAAAHAALDRWAALVAGEPATRALATLAGCRHVATLLPGALALARDEVEGYAGSLIAALHARYQPERDELDWPEVVGEIMRQRGEPDAAPPPATHPALAEAERRLGLPLPAEYRAFLLTCDGLPADVVFPRLLGAAELTLTGTVVPISEPPVLVLRPDTGEIAEWDPLFGTTAHRGVRALLEEHLRLLTAAG